MQAIKGPYNLHVGCHDGMWSSPINDWSMGTNHSMPHNGATSSYRYTISTIPNLIDVVSYCDATSVEVVQTNGAAWSGAAKLTGVGSQPYTTWELVSSSTVENFAVKFKANYPGTITS